jgi:hypothetical protein
MFGAQFEPCHWQILSLLRAAANYWYNTPYINQDIDPEQFLWISQRRVVGQFELWQSVLACFDPSHAI